MKPEDINIAIAEICGWTKIREQDYNHGYSGCDVRQYWTGTDPDGEQREMPNYHGSLDATHEAENSLTGEQWQDYIEQLEAVTHTDAWPIMSDTEQRKMIGAAANQRAEAFLRVFGKWVESAIEEGAE